MKMLKVVYEQIYGNMPMFIHDSRNKVNSSKQAVSNYSLMRSSSYPTRLQSIAGNAATLQ